MFLSLVCASCTFDQRKRFVAIVSSCAAALLLSAVWWVPFLEYLAYAQTFKLSLALGVNSYLLLFWGLYLAYRIRHSGYATCRRELVWLFVLAACAVLLVNLFDLKLHVYRFVIFPLLLVPPLLLSRTNKASGVKVLNTLAIATITYGLGFSGDFWTAIEKRGPPSVDYSMLDTKAGDGRDLIISSGFAQPSRHVAQHYIPMTTRRPAAKGLFVEASQNSSYVLTLERLIDPGAMTWGVPLRPNGIRDEAQAKRVALRLLGLFGIDRVISTQYSSLLRELPWKDLGAYRSHAPYIHLASRPDLGFRLEGLPSYAARIDRQRIVLVQNRGEILQATLVRTDRPVEGPVRIRLGTQQVYLRPADSHMWRAFSPMAGNADPLRAAKGLDQLIVKLPEAAQSGEVLELQRWVKESLQQMEIDDFADSALLEAKVEVEEVIDAPARKATWQAEEILFRELGLPGAELASVVHASSSRQYSPLWEDAVDQWLLEESSADVITDAPQNQLRSFEGEIQHIAVDKTHERIGFEIISDQPVPVLIRESFFPKWRAYQSGNPIPIYRAAPNLMLVVASGQIEMRYENSPWEQGAILVSAITLIILTALSLIGALTRLA